MQKNRRYCLVVILPQVSFEKLGEICTKYNILNPKNQNYPNVSDIIRMMLYYQIRINKVRCLSPVDTSHRFKQLLDSIGFDKIEFKPMKDDIGRDKCEERRTIRVTDYLHESVIALSDLLKVDYGDIVRCCADFLIKNEAAK
jgi:hypothetical protein